MLWGMAWCGLQPHLVIERKVVAHKLCLVRFDHWHDAIDEMGRVFPVQRLPGLPFPLGEDVPRFGEGRHPAPVAQLSVPPHMVPVQVRAHHVVHLLRSYAGRSEAREEGVELLLMPMRPVRQVLVISDTSIDEDRMMPLRAH
jgi:hypothetical protein